MLGFTAVIDRVRTKGLIVPKKISIAAQLYDLLFAPQHRMIGTDLRELAGTLGRDFFGGLGRCRGDLFETQDLKKTE